MAYRVFFLRMLESRRCDLCIIVHRKFTRTVLLAGRHACKKITATKGMIFGPGFINDPPRRGYRTPI